MPKKRICVHCEGIQKRIYTREFTRKDDGKYKSKYIPIGWYCPGCKDIERDYY